MAIEYALVVPGETSVEEMWRRLHEAQTEPTVRNGVWSADEWNTSGYLISVHRGFDGYFEVGDWIREFDQYLNVGFRENSDGSPPVLARNLLGLVQRVLDSGDEDLWLSVNGEELILERVDGEVRRAGGLLEQRRGVGRTGPVQFVPALTLPSEELYEALDRRRTPASSAVLRARLCRAPFRQRGVAAGGGLHGFTAR